MHTPEVVRDSFCKSTSTLNTIQGACGAEDSAPEEILVVLGGRLRKIESTNTLRIERPREKAID
jgi:hypothetical protein